MPREVRKPRARRRDREPRERVTLELPRTLVAHVAEQAAVSGVTLERWAVDALEVVAASARCRHRPAPPVPDP